MDESQESKKEQDITNESECLENKNKLAEIHSTLGQVNDINIETGVKICDELAFVGDDTLKDSQI